jgi:hypothetical protein
MLKTMLVICVSQQMEQIKHKGVISQQDLIAAQASNPGV